MKEKTGRVFVFYFLNIILPLAAGLAIYVLFRSDTYIGSFFSGGAVPEHAGNGLPIRIIRGYAADIFWAYSLTFAVTAAVEPTGKKRIGIFIFILCSLFATAVEILQKFGVISGTFDVFDIAAEIFAILAASLIIKIFKEKRHEKH